MPCMGCIILPDDDGDGKSLETAPLALDVGGETPSLDGTQPFADEGEPSSLEAD